jgi:hypothetical protein
VAPQSPTAEEVAVNTTANFVWPGLEFDILKSGEAVYVGRVPIAEGTLIPFGGQFTTHWEYLIARASNPASVAAWIPVEDHDRDGRPLWFNPAPENPLIQPLHLSVGEATGRDAAKLNMEIAWSVFAPEEQFCTSSRFVYRSIEDLAPKARLWGPPRRGFYDASAWRKEANKAATAMKAAFLRGVEDPDKDVCLYRRCMGNAKRDDRIYGAYSKTVIASTPVRALPASCLLPASVSKPQPIIEEGNSIAAPGEDLAVEFLLPPEYHGVLIQPAPNVKLLALTSAFMDPAFEPVSNSNPPRAMLAKWWRAVSQRIRGSYNKMAMPDALKVAMRGRARLYAAPEGEVVDVANLAADDAVGDLVAEAADEGSAPAKRLRRSGSRPRAVASSSSSSGPGGSGTGMNRGVSSQPRSVMGDGRGLGAVPSGASPASGSGSAGGALSAEEKELFKALLLRVLERL